MWMLDAMFSGLRSSREALSSVPASLHVHQVITGNSCCSGDSTIKIIVILIMLYCVDLDYVMAVVCLEIWSTKCTAECLVWLYSYI